MISMLSMVFRDFLTKGEKTLQKCIIKIKNDNSKNPLCYTLVLHSCATLLCYTLVLHSCATPLCYTLVLHSCARKKKAQNISTQLFIIIIIIFVVGSEKKGAYLMSIRTLCQRVRSDSRRPNTYPTSMSQRLWYCSQTCSTRRQEVCEASNTTMINKQGI